MYCRSNEKGKNSAAPWLNSKFCLEGINDHLKFPVCNTLSKFVILSKLQGLEVSFMSIILGNTRRLVDTGTNHVVL